MTTNEITNATISTDFVLLQARAIQGGMSQKKWFMAWEPQKDRLLMSAVGTAMAMKAQIQEPWASCTEAGCSLWPDSIADRTWQDSSHKPYLTRESNL
jgi:hypothetical protein